jgi:hypothetical protein
MISDLFRPRKNQQLVYGNGFCMDCCHPDQLKGQMMTLLVILVEASAVEMEFMSED